MDKMTDSRAVEVVRQGLAPYAPSTETDRAVEHIAARLREPAGVGGEVVQRLRGVLQHAKMGNSYLISQDLIHKAIDAITAPPSAPVGVPADILRIVDTAIDVCNDRDRPAMAEDLAAVRLYVEQASAALAQQPKITLADIRQSAPYWKERASLLQERLDALEAQQPAACPATPMDLIAADPTVAYKRGWDDALAQQPTPPSAPVGVQCNRPNVACAWPDCGRDCRHLAQQPAADGDFTAADMMDARQEGRKEAQQPAAVDGALVRELRGHEVERLLRRYAAQHEKLSPRMAQMMELGARAVAALTAQPAAVDGAYPTPRNRAEAVALARLALAYLGVIDAHIDAAIARCETIAAQPGGAE